MTREERIAIVLRTLVARNMMRSRPGEKASLNEVLTTIGMMNKLRPKILQEMIEDAESIVIALGE